jgi:hypothetical protein
MSDEHGARACEDCGELTRMHVMHMTDNRPFYAKCDKCLTKYLKLLESQQEKPK